MTGKLAIAVAVIAVLAVAGGAGAYYYTTNASNSSHGSVSFSISDPPAVFSAVQLNITAISIHNASGPTYTKTLSPVQAIFLNGTNSSAFLGKLGIQAGHYQSILFTISSANVTYEHSNYKLTLVNNTVRIAGQFTVVSGKTLALDIIFDSTASIHGTPAAGFTLTPVVSRVVSNLV